ncbi:unnamed protein product [Caenorhabditis brenneri]
MPQYFGQRAGRVRTHTSVSTGSLDVTQANALLDAPVQDLEVKDVKDDFGSWLEKYNTTRRWFCEYILDRSVSSLSNYLNRNEDKEKNMQQLTRIHNFLRMTEEMQRNLWQMSLVKDRKKKYVWPVDDDEERPTGNGVAAIDNGIPDHEMAMEVEDAEFEDHFMAIDDMTIGNEVSTAPLVLGLEAAKANNQESQFESEMIEPMDVDSAVVEALSPASGGGHANHQDAPEGAVDQTDSSSEPFGKPLEERLTARRLQTAEEGSLSEELDVGREEVGDAPNDAPQESKRIANAAADQHQGQVPQMPTLRVQQMAQEQWKRQIAGFRKQLKEQNKNARLFGQQPHRIRFGQLQTPSPGLGSSQLLPPGLAGSQGPPPSSVQLLKQQMLQEYLQQKERQGQRAELPPDRVIDELVQQEFERQKALKSYRQNRYQFDEVQAPPPRLGQVENPPPELASFDPHPSGLAVQRRSLSPVVQDVQRQSPLFQPYPSPAPPILPVRRMDLQAEPVEVEDEPQNRSELGGPGKILEKSQRQSPLLQPSPSPAPPMLPVRRMDLQTEPLEMEEEPYNHPELGRPGQILEEEVEGASQMSPVTRAVRNLDSAGYPGLAEQEDQLLDFLNGQEPPHAPPVVALMTAAANGQASHLESMPEQSHNIQEGSSDARNAVPQGLKPVERIPAGQQEDHVLPQLMNCQDQEPGQQEQNRLQTQMPTQMNPLQVQWKDAFEQWNCFYEENRIEMEEKNKQTRLCGQQSHRNQFGQLQAASPEAGHVENAPPGFAYPQSLQPAVQDIQRQSPFQHSPSPAPSMFPIRRMDLQAEPVGVEVEPHNRLQTQIPTQMNPLQVQWKDAFEQWNRFYEENRIEMEEKNKQARLCGQQPHGNQFGQLQAPLPRTGHVENAPPGFGSFQPRPPGLAFFQGPPPGFVHPQSPQPAAHDVQLQLPILQHSLPPAPTMMPFQLMDCQDGSVEEENEPRSFPDLGGAERTLEEEVERQEAGSSDEDDDSSDEEDDSSDEDDDSSDEDDDSSDEDNDSSDEDGSEVNAVVNVTDSSDWLANFMRTVLSIPDEPEDEADANLDDVEVLDRRRRQFRSRVDECLDQALDAIQNAENNPGV